MRFGTLLVLSLLVASIFLVDGWFLGRRRRRRTRRCPAVPPRLRHHRFDISLAKRMWRYSLAAYENPRAVETWTCKHCFADKRFNTRTDGIQFHFGRHATRAFTRYDRRLGSFVLSFRGSAHLKNWWQNLKFFKKSPCFFNGCGGKVHRGFLSSYEALREKLIAALRRLMRRYRYRVRRLHITGHSLGAAMATLAAPDLRNVLRLDTRVYTYSSPRVGDSSFVKYYNRRIATSWRCYNKGDFVVGIPPRWWPFRYRHVASGIAINSRFGGRKQGHRGHGKYFNIRKRR